MAYNSSLYFRVSNPCPKLYFLILALIFSSVLLPIYHVQAHGVPFGDRYIYHCHHLFPCESYLYLEIAGSVKQKYPRRVLTCTVQFIAFAPNIVIGPIDRLPPKKFSHQDSDLYFLVIPQIYILFFFSCVVVLRSSCPFACRVQYPLSVPNPGQIELIAPGQSLFLHSST